MSFGIRASDQINFDGAIDIDGSIFKNAGTPEDNGDLTPMGWVMTQIANAMLGLSGRSFNPVANKAAMKAITAEERTGKDGYIINAEADGMYGWDEQNTQTSDDNLFVRPTDIADDATAGRWVKKTPSIASHEGLANVLGGTLHFTEAEKNAATRIASLVQSGLLSAEDFAIFKAKYDNTNFVDRETPTGTLNGSNVAFTLANTPASGSEHVRRNGVALKAGADAHYTISGNTITFVTAPVAGDWIEVDYRKA